jgi:hypothetical protein
VRQTPFASAMSISWRSSMLGDVQTVNSLSLPLIRVIDEFFPTVTRPARLLVR